MLEGIFVVSFIVILSAVLFLGVCWLVDGEPIWAGLIRQKKEKRKKLIKDLEL